MKRETVTSHLSSYFPNLQSVIFDDVTDKKKSIEDKLPELSKESGKE